MSHEGKIAVALRTGKGQNLALGKLGVRRADLFGEPVAGFANTVAQVQGYMDATKQGRQKEEWA